MAAQVLPGRSTYGPDGSTDLQASLAVWNSGWGSDQEDEVSGKPVERTKMHPVGDFVATDLAVLRTRGKRGNLKLGH